MYTCCFQCHLQMAVEVCALYAHVSGGADVGAVVSQPMCTVPRASSINATKAATTQSGAMGVCMAG